MKRVLAVLGVFALLGTLFIVASGPASSDEKIEDVPVNDIIACALTLDVDIETIIELVHTVDPVDVDWKACCIAWDSEYDEWVDDFKCAPPACYDEFGDLYDELIETYGDLVDKSECCIDVERTLTIPTDHLQFRCEVPEPEPTPTEPPVEPTPAPTPDVIFVPVEVPADPIIIERPAPVAVKTVSFTG